MGGFDGIIFNKQNGGIGTVVVGSDAVGMLSLGGAIASGNLSLGEVVVLGSATEADAFGITAEYDELNEVHVRRHIDAFFSQAPAASLHVVLHGTNNATELKALIKSYLNTEPGANVRVIGVGFNIQDADTPVYANGFLQDTLDMVGQAQALVSEMAAKSSFIDLIAIEGRADETYTAGSLFDFPTEGAQNVAIIAGRQLPETTNLQYSKGCADIGAFLGSVCARDVAESAGSVDVEVKPRGFEADKNYPIRHLGVKWKDCGVSIGGYNFAEIPASLTTELKDKHIIYAGRFNGYPGIYWSGSETCTTDDDDYSRIERNRVWNKCARAVIDEMTPKIRGKVPINADGTIRGTTVTSWSLLNEKRLKAFADANLISGYEVYIDPAQNVLALEPIEIQLSVTPIGIAEGLLGTIKLANPYNS